jgi:hypothetical protein
MAPPPVAQNPQTAGIPPAPQYVYAPGVAMQQTSTNGLSIAALVLGIVWIFGLGSILAVIFGFV